MYVFMYFEARIKNQIRLTVLVVGGCHQYCITSSYNSIPPVLISDITNMINERKKIRIKVSLQDGIKVTTPSVGTHVQQKKEKETSDPSRPRTGSNGSEYKLFRLPTAFTSYLYFPSNLALHLLFISIFFEWRWGGGKNAIGPTGDMVVLLVFALVLFAICYLSPNITYSFLKKIFS